MINFSTNDIAYPVMLKQPLTFHLLYVFLKHFEGEFMCDCRFNVVIIPQKCTEGDSIIIMSLYLVCEISFTNLYSIFILFT